MNHRERFRSVLRGEDVAHIPLVCRLDIWHRTCESRNDWPADVPSRSLRELQLSLGMAVSARLGRVFTTRLRPGVEHHFQRQGDELVDTWHTPAGVLRRVRQYAPGEEASGVRPLIVEYPVKSLDDYAAWAQIAEHTEYVPDYAAFSAYDAQIGDDGLPMVILGPSPIHHMLLDWTGYERGFEDLLTETDTVEAALRVAEGAARRMWDVVAGSPCELVLHGAHFDSAMTPPPIFRRYFLPYFEAFNARMHEAGKYSAFHGDADLTLLGDLVLACGFDAIDCLATSPLVPFTIDRAVATFGDRLVLWGGIPSTLLESDVSHARMESHLESIFRAVKGKARFIGGFSDQAMPSSDFRRIRQVAEFFRRHGG